MAVIDGLSDEELQKLLADIIAAEGGTVSEGGDAGRVSTIDSSPALATGPRGRNLTLTPGTFDNPEIQGSAAQVDQILGGFGFDKATNPNGYNLMRRILFPDVQDNSGDGGGPREPGDINFGFGDESVGQSPTASSRPAGSIPTGTSGGRSVSGDGTIFDTVSGGIKSLFQDGATFPNDPRFGEVINRNIQTGVKQVGDYLGSRKFGNDVIRGASNVVLPFSGTVTGALAERQQINAFNDRMAAMGLNYRYTESPLRTLGENFIASFPPPFNFLRKAPKFPTVFGGDGGGTDIFDGQIPHGLLGPASQFTGSGITIGRKPKTTKPKIAPAPKPVAVAPPKPAPSPVPDSGGSYGENDSSNEGPGNPDSGPGSGFGY
jgi:hypothetical protein